MAHRKTPGATTAGALDAARAALRRGEPFRALRALLAGWRARPHAELADAIAELGARIAAHQAERELPADSEQAVAAIAAIAREVDPRELGQIHRGLAALARRPDFDAAATWPVFDALTRWPTDPRLARLACDLSEAGGNRCGKLWTRCAKLIRTSADALALARATELAQTRPQRGCSAYQRYTTKTLPKAIEAARQRLALLEPLREAERESLAEVVGLIDELTDDELARPPRAEPDDEAEQLLAQYYEQGDTDTLAILGDAWVAAGDPRGELIALAASERPALDDRVAKLERQHRKLLLGPLAPLVVQDARFESSFPVALTLKPLAAGAVAAVLDLREWRTLRELTFDFSDGRRHTYVSPRMSRLRALRRLCRHGLRRLRELAEPPPLRRLTLQWHKRMLADLDELEGLALEALDTGISYVGLDDAARVLESPCAEQLERLAVTLRPDVASRGITLLDRCPKLAINTQTNIRWTLDRRTRAATFRGYSWRRAEVRELLERLIDQLGERDGWSLAIEITSVEPRGTDHSADEREVRQWCASAGVVVDSLVFGGL